ncbi:Bug family tripartite tricarboxylate transporter substrate binding protein [Plastoroseomonas hellenica]|uniref:Tripartite tricarboxylate transporter substrate binding protein n=1 Tax=Plastoroseomonas hellenica TaxID=2687306 RepID=A0ABS5EU79_9PROT|nr:tripartite tricarboxylate transporter substrate binding protein [Plastoroseomonas hellenica]MBR0641530.1 tripartite tricarboxylate transporter substrate binding protein [Plastoroseomonas hellenica]MBR0663837.1 tripartite tricarboxylate transporter substrate binding protein [Plastoroseomonas hellenica]
MIPNRTLSRRAALAGLLGAAAAPAAFAQDQYPTRPVTIIVPWAPGGSTDILARMLADPLRSAFGQPFVVENRSGASGNIGSSAVARAAADGHTLLFGSMSTHAMNGALFRNMPFDGVADFSPIALLAYVLNTMVVHPSVPATTVPEFIAYAKANPGRIAYASAGIGSTNHLCAAMFARMTGIDIVHVPYRGGAPAVLDTVAGQTQLFFSAGTQTLEHVNAGRLRLLGVTEGRRSRLLPNVPTVAEAVPGYEMAVWYGALGPKGMPPALVARLNAAINRALALPEIRDRMAAIGIEVADGTADAFAATLRADAAKWGGVIRELGIDMSDA